LLDNKLFEVYLLVDRLPVSLIASLLIRLLASSLVCEISCLLVAW